MDNRSITNKWANKLWLPFLMMSLSHSAISQWSSSPTVNNPISTAARNQLVQRITPDGLGGAFIVWGDDRIGESYFNIFGQRVNAAGQAQWIENGIQLTTQGGNLPRIATTTEGTAIVAWRGGPGIKAQRMNSDGTMPWGANGITILNLAVADSYNLTYMEMVADGEGGAIVVWIDNQVSLDYNLSIKAQRINANGTVLWTSNGVLIYKGGLHINQYGQLPHSLESLSIASDGSGGAIIVWKDDRSSPVDTDIYAQRINGAGVIQWNTTGVPVANTAVTEAYPSVISDGAGGAIITWNSGFDIFAQRIDGNSNLLWTAGGVSLCSEANIQLVPVIASDNLGGAIVAWRDYRNGNFMDIYAQRVGPTGVVEWATNGVAVCNAVNHQITTIPNQSSPLIVATNNGGAIITWEDYRDGYLDNLGGSNADVYAQKISATGAIEWTANGVAISTNTANQIYPTIASNGNGGAIIAWSDFRNGTGFVGWDIYAQHVNAMGDLCSNPTTPESIVGPSTICAGNSNSYSIPVVPGATSYTWTLPSGWTGTSTTTSILATASASSGNISVTANNNCGLSTAQTLTVTVNLTGPVQPGSITGNSTICSGSSNTYSISPVSGATSYTWTLPSGWTGTATTASITTTASSTSGNISVTANNSCGSSTAQTLAVTVNTSPPTPGAISGSTSICSGSSNTYNISAVSGATSYTWTLPSGWTGTSTTASITTTASSTSGNISVTANNSCGSSTAQTLAVTVNTSPLTPGAISGSTSICSGSSNTYSISTVSGATSYTWTLPSGWTGTSTTTSITTTASSTSGNISVTANNICGSSTAQTLAVTVNTSPPTPGAISGSTSICSGSSNTYSISAVSGATSYTWTLPSGWTGTSTIASITTTASSTSGNISVTANNSCGSSTAQTLAVTVNTSPLTPGAISGSTSICSGSSNTYSISAVSGATSYAWTLPSGWTGTSTTASITTTASSTSGNISVTANNSCGSSTAQTLAVTVNTSPLTPGAISGSTSICSGSSNTYSISTVSGATSYTWTLPSGWTGTSTTTSITTTASSTSGNISVTANNICGSSTAQTVVLSATLASKPTITVDFSNPAAPILTSSSADSYQWLKDGITVGTSRSFVVTESGVYTVIVTINGCSSVLSDPQAMIITGDISSNVSLLTTLYPNPVSDYAILSLDGFEKSQPVSISIADMLGRVIDTSTELGQDAVLIDMLTYPDGKYVALLQQRDTRISLVFIKIQK